MWAERRATGEAKTHPGMTFSSLGAGLHLGVRLLGGVVGIREQRRTDWETHAWVPGSESLLLDSMLGNGRAGTQGRHLPELRQAGARATPFCRCPLTAWAESCGMGP